MHRIFCLFVTLCITIIGAPSSATAADTIPPSVPTGLQVSSFTCGLGVTLTWNPSTDTGGSGLAGYHVYRNDVAIGGTFLSPTTFLDPFVALLTNYSYTVSAYDGVNNNSAKSAPVFITTPSCAGQKPVADAGGHKMGQVGRSMNFDASHSFDTDGHIVSYEWNFGDGTKARLNNPVTSHTYSKTISYTATLTVQDDVGLPSSPLPIVVGVGPEICRGDGFYLENPGPIGEALKDVWPFSLTDVWAVGDHGNILHFDGTTWAPAQSNTTETFERIWASAPNDVWAVAWHKILHWNGSTWSTILEGSPLLGKSIWGTSSSDVWIPLFSNGMLHFDGSLWSQPAELSAVRFYHLWGAQGQIFALSNLGLYRYNGTSWSLLPSSIPLSPDGVSFDDISKYYAMWGSSPSDLWIVGESSRIRRWDGARWNTITSPAGIYRYTGVWGSSSTNVYIGSTATTIRWDGSAFSTVGLANDPELGGSFKLTTFRGTGADDIWGLASGKLRHWNGITWSPTLGFAGAVYGLWGTGPTDVYATDMLTDIGGGLLHWDGSAWSKILTAWNLGGVFGFNSADLWAVGVSGVSFHYNGQSWSEFPIALKDLWGASPNDIWGVDRDGGGQHWNGSAWSPVTIWSPGVNSANTGTVWGTASNRVWAGAGNFNTGGKISYYNGSTWVTQYNGLVAPTKIWGSSESDIWAVGVKNSSGAILHFNGVAWSEVPPIANNFALWDVWGLGPDDVWAVGSGGRVIHFDGTQWQSVNSGTDQNLTAVWGTNSELWIGGHIGGLLRNFFDITCNTPPTISSSSPPNGYIDPLEDRNASTGALYGVKDISITFSAPVTATGGGAVTPSDFLPLSFTRNGAPATDLQTGQVPIISSVVGSGAGPPYATYTLHLSSRIPLGAWTKITAQGVIDSSGAEISPIANSIVLGFLPMDVTQDGKVLGNDIDRWLGIKNGSYPLPAPLTTPMFLDQKRNGVIAGEDITRAIQLINGTSGTTFRAWSGFDMGVKP